MHFTFSPPKGTLIEILPDDLSLLIGAPVRDDVQVWGESVQLVLPVVESSVGADHEERTPVVLGVTQVSE